MSVVTLRKPEFIVEPVAVRLITPAICGFIVAFTEAMFDAHQSIVGP